MDILEEIPRSKWIQLRDLYKNVWPTGAVAYCVLDLHMPNHALSNISNFKVYCPEGDITIGMIATIDLFGYYQVLIHPLNDLAKIEEALLKTNVIDWSRDLFVPSATPNVVECLKSLQNRLGFNMRCNTNACKYLLDDNIPQYELRVHLPDTYVAPLRPEDISFVDEKWMYHSDTTNKFFQLLIDYEMTYVLYSKKGDKPIAWIMIDAEGALTHFYTLEPYRRRGYGEFITKYAINDLRKKGRKVLAYTVNTNKNAQKMFEKLGFSLIGIDQWIYIHK